MKIFTILVAKMIILAGKILKRGSVLPGNIALRLDKNILKKLKMPDIVIAVTGSSGKGSTTSLIADSLRSLNYKVTHNKSGSNLTTGILTTILEDTSLTGKVKTDAVIVECDERYAKFVFPAIKPNYVVVTNITRDQPPRQGNFDIVFNEIKKAITNDMTLVLNSDDPYMQKFATCFDNIIYYSVLKNKYSTKESLFENLNLVYCPRCNTKLDYKYFHFENIGNYECKNCGLKHPDSKFEVSDINYEENEIIINGNKVSIPFPMLFAIYNTLAAYSVLSLIGINEEKVSELINNNTKPNIKQYNKIDLGDRLVYVINNKNENSTTFNQSLLLLNRDSKPKTVVIGWKEISRRYKYNDLSWLYDIDFEILNNHKIEKVICVGKERYDIASRVKIAGLDNSKIECFQNLEDATKYLKTSTNENIYAILNFDYVEPFTNLIKEENND